MAIKATVTALSLIYIYTDDDDDISGLRTYIPLESEVTSDSSGIYVRKPLNSYTYSYVASY